ncbi:hypothetical protein BGZ83_000625 [Gryganskiella cystojenkinii]|nr:hypothetical protein BGZ83_000625 [Gryganskiella cystojenkinii]
MTRARQLQQSYLKGKSNSFATKASSSIRHRKPRTKDALAQEKRIRQLDEAIVTGDITALRRLSVTGPGFANDGIRRRAWRETATGKHPPTALEMGFHDVCTTLLIVLGKEAATLAAETLAMFFFRDCMLDNLEPVLDQLSLMTALLKLEDPEVQAFLDKSDTLPFFPLSWVITWCAHDLNDFAKVARLYDFLICFNPLMSVYLTAAVVISRREELFEIECDNAMVHTFLTKFPKDVNLERIISHAHELYTTYPPESLQNHTENWLDENSCVNTFSKPGTSLYNDQNGKTNLTAVDFGPIDALLSKPRVKRTKETSVLSKYSPSALQKYRRNMATMVAFSAASVGTAALLLMNSAMFREWLANSGLR